MKTFEKIVLNIPHSSNYMAGIAGWKKDVSFIEKVNKWTDWYTDLIFDKPSYLSNDEIIPIVFPYSRFYVDAERLINDEKEKEGQGIIYTNFENCTRVVSNNEKEKLMAIYNSHIDLIKSNLNDKTFLLDCHSFPSELSDIDVCIGFNDDWSKPDDELIEKVKSIFEKSNFKVGINYPYSNSISPNCNFNYKSMMIEINKRCYMNENNLSLKNNFYIIANLISKVYSLILEK